MIDTGVLITALIGVVTTFASGWTSWFFTRKKYNSEVDQTVIHNMNESLEFYKKLSDDIKERELVNLTNGPGKLVMAMNMSKDMHYGVDLVQDGNLWIEQGDESRLNREEIVRSKRINVDYAEFGKDYLLRFHIKNNKFVSKK